KAAGLGIKHIARKMGCSKNTVRRYLRGGGWVAYKRPERQRALRGLERWLSERLQRHRGNADVVRRDLEREQGITVSLRTVDRANCCSITDNAKPLVNFHDAQTREVRISLTSAFASLLTSD